MLCQFDAQDRVHTELESQLTRHLTERAALSFASDCDFWDAAHIALISLDLLPPSQYRPRGMLPDLDETNTLRRALTANGLYLEVSIRPHKRHAALYRITDVQANQRLADHSLGPSEWIRDEAGTPICYTEVTLRTPSWVMGSLSDGCHSVGSILDNYVFVYGDVLDNKAKDTFPQIVWHCRQRHYDKSGLNGLFTEFSHKVSEPTWGSIGAFVDFWLVYQVFFANPLSGPLPIDDRDMVQRLTTEVKRMTVCHEVAGHLRDALRFPITSMNFALSEVRARLSVISYSAYPLYGFSDFADAMPTDRELYGGRIEQGLASLLCRLGANTSKTNVEATAVLGFLTKCYNEPDRRLRAAARDLLNEDFVWNGGRPDDLDWQYVVKPW